MVANKTKKPTTDGTMESPHILRDRDWLTEAVSEHLAEGHPEGFYIFYVVSSADLDEKTKWHWEQNCVSAEKAQAWITKDVRDRSKYSVEMQRRRWERDNSVHQTRKHIQFTLNKKTSKKKIGEYADQMKASVEALNNKKNLVMPKFKPLPEDIPQYKIERVIVNLRRELVT